MPGFEPGALGQPVEPTPEEEDARHEAQAATEARLEAVRHAVGGRVQTPVEFMRDCVIPVNPMGAWVEVLAERDAALAEVARLHGECRDAHERIERVRALPFHASGFRRDPDTLYVDLRDIVTALDGEVE